MVKVYSYVGPHDLRLMASLSSPRFHVRDHSDIVRWIRETRQRLDPNHGVVATFVIDTSNQLWIADRHSEHVACAAGQDILSAGEITFTVYGSSVEVAEVTNQSTGYCPEPESWPMVAAALELLAIPHPADFTTRFHFRRCDACGTTNIVKDDWFECAVCQAPLSAKWNYASSA